jgi:hypothetical protein
MSNALEQCERRGASHFRRATASRDSAAVLRNHAFLVRERTRQAILNSMLSIVYVVAVLATSWSGSEGSWRLLLVVVLLIVAPRLRGSPKS